MSSRSVQPDAMSTEVMAARIASLQAEMAAKAAEAAALAAKVTALEESLTDLAHENTLLKRRLFGIRTERSQTSELQLALGDLLATEAKLQAELDAAVEKAGEAAPPAPPGTGTGTPRPHGRRNLFASNLPRVPVEIRNPELEAQGARLIRFEDSAQLGYRRGGFYVVVKRIAQYEVVEAGETTVVPAPPPATLFPKALLHTSTVAHLLTSKFGLGVPHYRLERDLLDQGMRLDRGLMCRYVEHAGNTLGATVVAAMWRDAIATGQLISTDATGALIQPTKAKDGKSLACKKGHFFTAVVDADAVLFAYVERHTSEAVKALFGEFRGLLQADASAVYEVLARGRPPDTDDGVVLVGCWAHCRRYFFEAALCRHPAGVQGLMRIRAIYAADAAGRRLPRAERGPFRATHLRPLMDEFFACRRGARPHPRPHPRDQGARLRAQPAGRAAPRPRRRRPPPGQHARRARAAQDRRRPQELALLRHRHPRRGRRRGLQPPRHLPPARARPVRLPRRGPARPAVLAPRALPRARAPALARHSRPARSGRPRAPDRPPARAPTATSSGPRPRHAPDRRAP